MIYGLSNASTTTSATLPAVVTGIAIRSGTGNLTIQNNMIAIGNGQTTNTIFAGIWGNHGSTPDPVDRIYYNTVNIEGTVASGAYSTMGFMRGDFTATARTMTVDVRKQHLQQHAFGRNGQALCNRQQPRRDDERDRLAGGRFEQQRSQRQSVDRRFLDGGSDVRRLESGVVERRRELLGNPRDVRQQRFGSPFEYGPDTDLDRIGRRPGSITTDIDGQTRPGPTGSVNGGAFAPDIGADEFDGVFLDGVAPLITYTPLANASTTGNRTLSVNISDATGGVASGGNAPRVYFKKSTDVSYVSTACTLSSGTPQNGAYNCLIDLSLVGGGSGSPGDTIQYFVVAQDTVGNLAANPSSALSASTSTQ
ncbi:MAG: hypothetical protein IPJ30_25625 [Acidobacteria bacterium]|nr:hypothetical protein [Acidobacteriota bacterium]